MAFVIADRVRETTTTIGTGSITLAGAYTSFQSFSAAIGNGNNTYYTIASASSGEWEVGIGTYSSGGNLLSRDTVLSSSNAGNLVNFSVGSKDVFVTQPAERSLLLNSGSTGLFAGNAAFTANGVPYANSTSTLTTGSALTFDGSNLLIGATTAGGRLSVRSTGAQVDVSTSATDVTFEAIDRSATSNSIATRWYTRNGDYIWNNGSYSEAMRLTSTGLGIGTSSPGAKLDVRGANQPLGSANGRFITTDLFSVANAGGKIGLGGTYSSSSQITNYAEIKGNKNNATDGDYGGYLTFNTQSFPDGMAEKMRLDSSGNLGLGVTPSAWGSFKAIDIFGSTGGAVASTNGSISQSINTYYNGTNWAYKNAGFATRYEQLGGGAGTSSHAWYVAASGAQNATISFTQAMTLDASGNLLIGTTSSVSAQTRIHAVIPTIPINTTYEAVRVTDDTSADFKIKLTAGASTGVSNGVCVVNTAAYNMAFEVVNAERMRLDSSGNLGLGTSSPFAKLQVVAASADYFNPQLMIGEASNSTGKQLHVGYNTTANTGYIQAVHNGTGYKDLLLQPNGGNLGLGVTPSAWSSGGQIAMGNNKAIVASGEYNNFGANWYYNAAYKKITNGYASNYYQAQGAHIWQTTGSGTADFTFTSAMTLDASGNLGIGTSSPATKLHIDTASAGYGLTLAASSLTARTYRFGLDSNANLAVFDSNAAAVRLTLDTSGNLGLGVTPSAWGAGKAIEVGFLGNSLYGNSSNNMNVVAGAYFNSGFKYAVSSVPVSYYNQSNGAHAWLTAASGTAGNAISFTQAMTLDASGNLGVGTTSPVGVLEASSATPVITASQNNTAVTADMLLGAFNAYSYDTSTNSKGGVGGVRVFAGGTYNTGFTPSYLAFYTHDNVANNNTLLGAATERARIDSSGNLLVGAASGSAISGSATVVAVRDLATSNLSSFKALGGAAVTQIEFFGAASTTGVWTSTNHPMLFATNNTERARIDSSGNLLVGKTSTSDTVVGVSISPSGSVAQSNAASTNSTVVSAVYSTGASDYRFYVGMGGTVYATSTTITAISDQRLKENIQDIDVGLDAIMALKPRKFDWKSGKGKDKKGDRGWIAQEFEQVFPDMVDTWADPAPEGEEPYKAVNADLIPVLVKAIQELKAEFDAYKATHP